MNPSNNQNNKIQWMENSHRIHIHHISDWIGQYFLQQRCGEIQQPFIGGCLA